MSTLILSMNKKSNIQLNFTLVRIKTTVSHLPVIFQRQNSENLAAFQTFRFSVEKFEVYRFIIVVRVSHLDLLFVAKEFFLEA